MENKKDIPPKVFQEAFDHSPVGTAVVGRNNEWLYINESLASAFGFAIAEWPDDRTWRDFTIDKDIDGDQKAVNACLQRNGPSGYTLEKRYHGKNEGEWFWAKLTVCSVRDSKGELEYFISYIQPKPRPHLANALLALAIKNWKPVSAASTASFFMICWAFDLITTEKLKEILEIIF